MEKIIKYSVLRYIPSQLSGEIINLGILFSDECEGTQEFRFTRNFNRIISFDDSLDKWSLMTMLKGIEQEVETRFRETGFDIDEYIRYYINEFRFDKTVTIKYDSAESIKEDLYKTYFRFDYEKKNRPSLSDDKRMLSKIILSNGHEIKQETKVCGVFDESIAYDIVTADYYVKLFDFDGKDLKRTINTAKAWAWNCNHERKKVYIVYRYDENDVTRDDFEIIRRIFSDSKACFCSIEEGVNLFQEVG